MDLPRLVFLALSAPGGGPVSLGVRRGHGVARAALIRLAQEERLTLDKGEVEFRPSGPPADPVLAAAFRQVHDGRRRKLADVGALHERGIETVVGEALEEEGRVTRARRLGRTIWPPTDPSTIEDVRSRIQAVVRNPDLGSDPDARMALCIVLLSGALSQVVPHSAVGLRRRVRTSRAKRVLASERQAGLEVSQHGGEAAVFTAAILSDTGGVDGDGGGDGGGDSG